MPKHSPSETLRVHCEFTLEDDDSRGPTGPDYLYLAMTPKKSDLKNPILREMSISIYLKETVSAEIGEQLERLLSENVSWVQFVLPKHT